MNWFWQEQSQADTSWGDRHIDWAVIYLTASQYQNWHIAPSCAAQSCCSLAARHIKRRSKVCHSSSGASYAEDLSFPNMKRCVPKTNPVFLRIHMGLGQNHKTFDSSDHRDIYQRPVQLMDANDRCGRVVAIPTSNRILWLFATRSAYLNPWSISVPPHNRAPQISTGATELMMARESLGRRWKSESKVYSIYIYYSKTYTNNTMYIITGKAGFAFMRRYVTEVSRRHWLLLMYRTL